jgi:hypothetical protein
VVPVSERKTFLLRLEPALHDVLAKWAADELRSLNSQVEYVLREAARKAGKLQEKRGNEEGKLQEKRGKHGGAA